MFEDTLYCNMMAIIGQCTYSYYEVTACNSPYNQVLYVSLVCQSSMISDNSLESNTVSLSKFKALMSGSIHPLPMGQICGLV